MARTRLGPRYSSLVSCKALRAIPLAKASNAGLCSVSMLDAALPAILCGSSKNV